MKAEITSFQAFATTVGARVGMGNIAGVASAIFYGGPGSVFWMWMIAAIGAASAFVESALGQAYKVKNPDGEFSGRPCILHRKRFKMQTVCDPFCNCCISGTWISHAGCADQLTCNSF